MVNINVQLLALVAVRESNSDVGKVAPVRAWSRRNVLHPSMNQRTHLLADVVSEDRLILLPSDLTAVRRSTHNKPLQVCHVVQYHR